MWEEPTAAQEGFGERASLAHFVKLKMPMPARLSCSAATPWTVVHQAPLSLGFSRQEYCRGLPIPPPGDLPDPGIEPESPGSPVMAGRFFTTEPPGKPRVQNAQGSLRGHWFLQ